MTDKQCACAVMQTIRDDQKRHKLGLGTLMMEAWTEEEVENLTTHHLQAVERMV